MPYQFRCATIADVPTLCHHRRRMFEDMGHRDPELLDPMAERFAEWVAERIANQTYLAWVVVNEAQEIVASAGLWLVDWPPHVMGPDGPRGYILNIFTEQGHRRQGLARRLTNLCLDACRERNIAIVALHASEYGRSLYESLGFLPSNEMRMRLAADKDSGNG
ncbi:MAG TPA: GNAT family N-acetyltransferase [Gemmatales bacterium]|nr:GNAT family N-acetyltransferase [Gemmatales bacterium]